MRNASLAFTLMFLAGVALAQGRWDSPYTYRSTFTATSAAAGTGTLTPNQYVKVACVNVDAGTTHADAYVGTSIALPDAGPSVTCSATTCELVRYSIGEKFYQAGSTRTKVSALCAAGGCSCVILQGP